jgi:REP element-mobilizing transposase RayT
MQIFLDDVDYTRFLELLTNVVEDCGLECWSYCILPNHYHLAVDPTLPNLSAALQFLNSTYGQWWNKRHETVGHVFQGRFKDQIIDRDEYLLAVCRYIARNPVRANLVAEPEDWRWSSYAATLGMRPAHSSFALTNVLRQFGDDDIRTLQQRYAEFVSAETHVCCTDERIRSRERILGSVGFKSEVNALVSRMQRAHVTREAQIVGFEAHP